MSDEIKYEDGPNPEYGDSPAPDTVTGRPVLGMIAIEMNRNRLVSRLLEAQERGYSALITYYDEEVLAVDAARILEAEVVRPDAQYPDAESLRDSLVRAARDRGYPGLIFHERLDEPVDFERTQSRFREIDTYAINASTVSEASESESSDCLVAIPAYNEATAIESVVRDVSPYADTVVVIDDGSSDDTAALAADAGAIVIQHENNKGYGGALKTAFTEAKQRGVDHLVIIDGDGQHDASDIPNLVSTQREREDNIVIGSRFHDLTRSNIPLYRRVGLAIVNLLMAVTLLLLGADSRINDVQSGFRAYDSQAIRSLADDVTIGDGMDASLDIIFHACRYGYDVSEIGTTIRYDVVEANTHNPVRHGIKLVRRVLLTLQRERPIVLLGIPGFLSTLLGVGLGYWSVSSTILSGYTLVALALGVVSLTVAGLFVGVAGFVIHSLNVYLGKPRVTHDNGP